MQKKNVRNKEIRAGAKEFRKILCNFCFKKNIYYESQI